jgi:hypothetical protein
MPEAMLPAVLLAGARNGGVPSATASASHDVISGHHVHRCIQVELAVRRLAVWLSDGRRRPCP